VLARLKTNTAPTNLHDALAGQLASHAALLLREEPLANVGRYDGLRAVGANSQSSKA